MNLQLKRKTALVTGSTAGIGFAIAQALTNEGTSVIVNGRADKRVDDAVKKMHNSGVGGKLRRIVADLGTADGVRCVIERFPQLDILVNNLGIFERKPFEQISDDDWQQVPIRHFHRRGSPTDITKAMVVRNDDVEFNSLSNRRMDLLCHHQVETVAYDRKNLAGGIGHFDPKLARYLKPDT